MYSVLDKHSKIKYRLLITSILSSPPGRCQLPFPLCVWVFFAAPSQEKKPKGASRYRRKGAGKMSSSYMPSRDSVANWQVPWPKKTCVGPFQYLLAGFFLLAVFFFFFRAGLFTACHTPILQYKQDRILQFLWWVVLACCSKLATLPSL